MIRAFVIKFICLIGIYIEGSCQSFAPVGAVWHYCEGEVFLPPGYQDYLKVTVIKDTIIQNLPSRKLEVDWLCWSPGGNQFVTTSQDSVYFFDRLLDNFKLIYAFKANPGDSIIIPVLDWEDNYQDTVILKIDSVSTILINGFTLAHQFVTYTVYDSFPGGRYTFEYQSEIIENIGDKHFIFNFPEQASRICDANYSCGLRCYEDSYYGLYETGIAPECTSTFVSTTDISNQEFKIYPNPTTNLLTIDGIDVHTIVLDMFDIIGRQCDFIIEKNVLDVSTLKNGIYILIAKKADGNMYSQKIIKTGS